MRIAIYSHVLKKQHIPYVQTVIDTLQDLKAEIFVYETYAQFLGGNIDIKQPVKYFNDSKSFRELQPDYMISMGGDGTILNAITVVMDSGVPILGVNLGRMGFLANVEKVAIRQSISDLFQGAYMIDKRTLLHLDCNIPLFGDLNFALNDCTLLKRDTSSMIIIHTYINGAFLNSYWADGIIIATPTGSTGYSLSCGGPIIFPNSGNFVITPVAPHNLNVRPIVISDNSVVSFEIEGRAKNFLCTMDSRYETISSKHQLAVKKADFQINLVRLHDKNFLSTIREKLSWGIDTRN